MAKRKSGLRYKSGRLRGATTRKDRAPVHDYGNDMVQKRRMLFDCMAIKGGKAADQVSDGIGQLWALDFLDGHGFEDTALRDAGRLFAELWWERYNATGPKTGQFERHSPTTGDPPPKGVRDYMFDRMDDALQPGYLERTAIVGLCIDPWFQDRVTPWAGRLIDTELLRRGRLVEFAELETPQDRYLLDGLIRGLCILVDAGLPARFERRAA